MRCARACSLPRAAAHKPIGPERFGHIDVGVWNRKELKPFFEHIRSMPWRRALTTLTLCGEDDSRPHLPTITTPALVMAGDKGLFIPEACSRELAAALPNGELVVLNGASHVLPLERPVECKALILDFLYRLATQRGELPSTRPSARRRSPAP